MENRNVITETTQMTKENVFFAIGDGNNTDLTPYMRQKLWQDSLDVVLMKALHCKSTKELKKKMASPCECRSGRKFKNCCGDNITHFAAQELAEQMKGNKDA